MSGDIFVAIEEAIGILGQRLRHFTVQTIPP